jgi:hypothetical protein
MWDTTGIYYHTNHTGVKTQRAQAASAARGKAAKRNSREKEERPAAETRKEISAQSWEKHPAAIFGGDAAYFSRSGRSRTQKQPHTWRRFFADGKNCQSKKTD